MSTALPRRYLNVDEGHQAVRDDVVRGDERRGRLGGRCGALAGCLPAAQVLHLAHQRSHLP